MEISETAIPDVKVIETPRFEDDRGHFQETWRQTWLEDVTFVQENQSRSKNNVLRGLHYQLPNPQGKLVRVTAGEIFDVAVDIRKSSPTYGQWVGEILSAENRKQLWVPEGFAHGFQVLSEFADVIYKCRGYYSPGDEHVLLWNDPAIGIAWPNTDPVMNDKDVEGKVFGEVLSFS